MSEWWTYRLSDFLLFSARTYYRLFELYNAEVWPAQLVALGLGIMVVALLLHGRSGSVAAACALLALCWGWVAWAFHWQRYATINWAATWFAGAFAIEGLLLLLVAGLRARRGGGSLRGGAGIVGLGLLSLALLAQPWTGVLFGRPWRQTELFGIAPDPTTVATLGLLLALRLAGGEGRHGLERALAWLPWAVPLLWCAVSGATLWALQAPDAWLLPCAAVLAVAVALACAWRAEARGSR